VCFLGGAYPFLTTFFVTFIFFPFVCLIVHSSNYRMVFYMKKLMLDICKGYCVKYSYPNDIFKAEAELDLTLMFQSDYF